MIVVVFLIALVMILGGGAATFFGSDILLADRGLPMVIAGSIVASAGALMLGLGFVIRGLSRIERQVAQVRDGIADVRAANLLATARPPQRIVPAAVPVADAETTEEGAALVVPDAPPVEPQAVAARPSPAPVEVLSPAPSAASVAPESARAEPVVVGRYESGGNAYTMFSDGSITADTASGQLRFDSLDELKAFVSAGGENR